MKRLVFLIPILIVALGLSTAHAAETAAVHVAAIQTRGNTDIDARVTSLNNLLTKVTSAKRLSSTQQAALATSIRDQATSLTTLKNQLDSETDVTAAKTDFQNIFAAHYIYAFYLPETERIVAADNEGQAGATLTALIPKLQALIDTAKSQGNDVTAIQASLNDIQTKAADATTQSTSTITSLSALSASGYPANKTTVTAAGTTLKNVRTELTAARADATTVVASLKKMLNKTTAATAQ